MTTSSSIVRVVDFASCANRLVLYGFAPLIAAILLIRLVIILPPAPFWIEKQPVLESLLGQSSRRMFAGTRL